MFAFTMERQLNLVSKELWHCWINDRISSHPLDLFVGFPSLVSKQ